MTPINQTVFDSKNGNCLEACFASILEIPIKQIPYFKEHVLFKDFNDFLKPFGFYCVIVNIPKKDFNETLRQFEGHYILVGASCNECNHAVIYKENKLVHDPHKRSSGLMGPLINEDFYQAYFFVSIF